MNLTVTALLTLASFAPAYAAQLTWHGALAPTDSSYNRLNTALALSSVGTSVYYDVYYFHTTSTGNVRIETTVGAFHSFITLYQGDFNATSPITNAVEADDDDGVGSLSKIIRGLNGGNDYAVVVTSVTNGVNRCYTLQVEGAVAPVGDQTGVPEPSTAILSIPALAAIYLRLRK